MNQLDGLGNKLKTYLEQAMEEISDARFNIAEEFQIFQRIIGFALERNADIRSQYTQLRNYVSEQQNLSVNQFRYLFAIMAKAVKPLIVYTNNAADELESVFIGLIGDIKFRMRQHHFYCSLRKRKEHQISPFQEEEGRKL